MAIPRNLANFAAGIDASNNIKAASGIFGTTPATTGVVRIPNNSPIFARNPGNDGDRHVIAFNSSGEVAIAGDGNNTVIGTSVGTVKTPTTISVGAATPAASGAGITFPATQSASTDANTLDDYEEGTWTPVAARFTGGNITAVYGGQNEGKYTKIGRMVILECSLDITSVSSQGSSLSQIKGLPFTAASSYLGNGAVFFNTAVTTINIVSGATNAGDNCIYLHESGNSATLASFDWKSGFLTITISYSI